MSPHTDSEVDAFIEFMTTEKNSSPKTLENYTLAIRLFQTWLGDRFSKWRDLTSDHFRAYLFQLQKDGLAR
ncbi:site-specific integrase, partial [bacterium]|nr:site-specific integrase [bacterium]